MYDSWRAHSCPLRQENRPAIFLTIVCMLLVAPLAVMAQDASKAQSLPTTQQVMDRYIKAIGGRDAIFKHNSMTIREKLEAGDVSVDRTVYYKDRKMFEDIALPNNGRYQSGYNGTTAWEWSSTGGADITKGEEAKSKVREADMHYPGRILDYFSSMDVVDVVDFEGHTCYHLKGTNNWGKVNEHFYDTTTGLLIGYRFNSAWRGGAGDESEVFSDYKSFDGWLIPTRIAHKEPKRTLTEVVSSVTFDDVPDSTFALPEPVQALLAKQP